MCHFDKSSKKGDKRQRKCFLPRFFLRVMSESLVGGRTSQRKAQKTGKLGVATR